MITGCRRAASAVVVLALCASGCATKAQTGAAVGAGGGAAVGAAAGSFSGNAGKGALIGAGIGAISGYFVGNEMDKSDARREQEYQYNTRSSRESRYSSSSVSSSSRITRNDVMNWTDQGVKDEIIIDRVERGGTVFRLTAADENELRDAGVSEDVIRSMKDTARR